MHQKTHYLLTSHIKCFSQPGSKGTQPTPDDPAVVLLIEIMEKGQSKLFTKNQQHAKKPLSGSLRENKI